MVRPRILVVAPGLRIGGVERSLLGLLHALVPRECDLTLFLHSHDGEWVDQIPRGLDLLPEMPEYAALDRSLYSVLLSAPWRVGVARAAAKLVTRTRGALGIRGFLLPRSVRYSIGCLPWIPGEYDLAVSFLAPHDVVLRRVRARFRVGWIHTDYTRLETGVDRRFEMKTWCRLDSLAAVSTGVAETFSEAFGIEASRIRVIENVLSPTFVRGQARATDVSHEMVAGPSEFRLCSVGRFSHAKGFDLAVEACRRLVDLGVPVRWYLIGYGPEEESLRRLISSLGVERQFLILGKRDNPYPYIAACDLYVQPSRYEGKAVTVREAQMLGRPVLIGRYPTASSQLEDGIDGMMADPGPHGLVDAIRRLVADPALRRRLGATAASRDYGNSAAAGEVLALAERAGSREGAGKPTGDCQAS